VRTAAGELRPRITGDDTCTVDMGHVRLQSEEDFPSGPEDGRGSLTAAGREFEFQFVQAGNPQCAIELDDDLEELELGTYGPEIERHELFPRRTNVSFWRREGDASIRARIFERGVGETMSSGTGATGAAVAAVLRGVDSPVTVRLDGGELQVAVGEDLHVELTGWARPVYQGEVSDELMTELHATE
jgi:diaminopimelate epimerase